MIIQLDAHGEPNEVLKAYNSSSLILTGNSTTLARWDARLGVHPPGPSSMVIATLQSLTPDGGRVMLLDATVMRVYAIGFMERREDGSWDMARNEKEEREAHDAWLVSDSLIRCVLFLRASVVGDEAVGRFQDQVGAATETFDPRGDCGSSGEDCKGLETWTRWFVAD